MKMIRNIAVVLVVLAMSITTVSAMMGNAASGCSAGSKTIELMRGSAQELSNGYSISLLKASMRGNVGGPGVSYGSSLQGGDAATIRLKGPTTEPFGSTVQSRANIGYVRGYDFREGETLNIGGTMKISLCDVKSQGDVIIGFSGSSSMQTRSTPAAAMKIPNRWVATSGKSRFDGRTMQANTAPARSAGASSGNKCRGLVECLNWGNTPNAAAPAESNTETY